MIPALNITAWGTVVPWGEPRQIEQDLIIARALVALFSDAMLAGELRFRGGTALNKLHFPQPLRYSEDIDLVRATAGPIGPVLDRARAVLEPWLGTASFDASPVAPKLRFRVAAEHDSAVPIRLKIEINVAETEAFDPLLKRQLSVENPWFTGAAEVVTFSREEILATKLRALLQRDKGRDLLDLDHGLAVFDGLNVDRVVELFGRYVALGNLQISRAQAEQRMFAKLARPTLVTDIRPLLPPATAAGLTDDAIRTIFRRVMGAFIQRIPGEPWAKSTAMMERFGLHASC